MHVVSERDRVLRLPLAEALVLKAEQQYVTVRVASLEEWGCSEHASCHAHHSQVTHVEGRAERRARRTWLP